MRILFSLLVVCAVAAFTAPSSQAAFVLYNTGANVSAGKDLSYKVSGPSTLLQQATVRTSNPGWGITPLSSWISPVASGSSPGGLYTYTTTFDLTGYFAPATLSGTWATDNIGVSILLNGNNLGSSIPYGTAAFNAPTNFSTSNSSYFVSGVNTLQFLVHNGQQVVNPSDFDGPTGLRVTFDTVTVVPVPLPPALGLFALGLPFAAFVRRRLAKR